MLPLAEAALRQLRHGRRFAMRVAIGFYAHHAFDHAAALSFYLFVGIIPLMVLAGFVLGRYVQAEGIDALLGTIRSVLPADAARIVEQQLLAMARAGSSIAPLSLLGFLVLATNGVHNLMDVFEYVLETKPRAWLRQRMIATGWVVASVAVLCLALWGLVAWDQSLVEEVPKGQSLIEKAAAVGMRFVASTWRKVGVAAFFGALSAAAIASFYRVAVSRPRGTRWRIWPGTFVSLAAGFAVSWVFGKYVSAIGQYSVYYGGLAAVAIFLVWIYLSSLAVLLGAEVNAQLDGSRGDQGVPESNLPPPSAPTPKIAPPATEPQTSPEPPRTLPEVSEFDVVDEVAPEGDQRPVRRA